MVVKDLAKAGEFKIKSKKKKPFLGQWKLESESGNGMKILVWVVEFSIVLGNCLKTLVGVVEI